MASDNSKGGAGSYNQRITVQVNTATATDRDDHGAQLEIWDEESFQLWAAFSAGSSSPGGAEYFIDPQRRVEDIATFKVRYWSRTIAMDPATYRIVYGSKTWNIHRVFDPDGSRTELTIEARSIN